MDAAGPMDAQTRPQALATPRRRGFAQASTAHHVCVITRPDRNAPAREVQRVFGDRSARVIDLQRRKQRPCAPAADTGVSAGTTSTPFARDLAVAGGRIDVEFPRWRVSCPRCHTVVVERLDWLARNPRDTLRFALHVGALCREMTNTAVAQVEHLHDSTLKDRDTLYMQRQVAAAVRPAPRVIGVDALSIRKGQHDRMIVSDRERARPIWGGGAVAPTPTSTASSPSGARGRRATWSWRSWTSCSRPISGSARPICSRNPSASPSVPRLLRQLPWL